jgi:hypothetical protein
MKIIALVFSLAFIFACSSPEGGGGSDSDKATEDTILDSRNAVPLDPQAAAKFAQDSWPDSSEINPENCAGCKDSLGNSYAPGYKACFKGIMVVCKGYNEKHPAGSGCFEEAKWYKLEGECK